jgi:glycosyltransferase involved in cell wall biosynthesis
MNTFGSSLSRVAVIGNYLPRQCGIATFTTDLCESIVAQYPDLTCLALPVNDRPDGYAYPERVRFELAQHDLTSYQRAADFLNMNNIEVVCLQHEYGIFGGPAGSHILALLRELRMPVVTTLHTILKEPDPHQRRVMLELIQLSDLLVVMSRRGAQFLQEIYGAPAEKIVFIHHGIPEVPFVDPNFYKDQFGVQGKIVLLTFGLLSPNKGIEYVIEALPALLEKFPNLVYIVLGATHPHVALREGESYRLMLERLARARKVDQHVIFHNRFVSLEELTEFIGAADIYITPYLNPAQIVSGTLAYTVGMGKAVVSTPYWYAEELLEDGRGVLVPFRDPDAIARRILELLECDGERHAMRKRAWLLGREMIWPRVARQYVETFERARELRATHPRPAFSATTLQQRPLDLPPLKLDHLRTLTDHTGVLQHAIFTVPNYNEGYTTDDNARALVLSVLLEQVGESFDLAPRYLGFLWHAFNPAAGRFRNFFAYNRQWLEEVGSEDSHGRALWALGMVLGRSRDPGLRGLAARLFDQALPATLEFTSPRAWAFTLIGIDEYLRLFSGDRAAQNVREVLAERLMDLYRRTRAPDWRWFEEIVAYDNATLPHALMLAGRGMGRADMEAAALEALAWLAEVQRAGGDHFVPIGSNGFYRRNGERARFDQQPVDAHAMVSACLEAWRLTGETCWQKEAQRAFEWFLGRNDLGLPLYDAATGGCRDGLHPDGVNQNEGAESTLSFLLALLEMTMAAGIIDAAKPPVAAAAA